MAKTYLTSINLNKNELQFALLHPLSSPPGTPAESQIYYNSVNKTYMLWNGTSWIDVGGVVRTLTQSGTPAIVISGTDSAVTIGISDANTTNSGLLSSTHWDLLDGATSSNTASTIVVRDASGEFSASAILGLSDMSSGATNTAATKGYVDTLVASGMVIKGSTDCSTNPNYPAGIVGDSYYVSVAGKIGGASGEVVEIGDMYICITISAGGDQAAVGSEWFVLQSNIGDATTTVSGKVILATQAEVDAGSDTTKVVTAETLTNFSGLGSGGGIGEFLGTSIAISSDDSALSNDDSSDNNNIALGEDTLLNATGGFNNIALGESVLKGSVGGIATHNIGMGYFAGWNITTGHYNTLLGWQTGRGLTSGSYNFMVGAGAGASGTTTGDDNILIGRDSGSEVTSGHSNIGIGVLSLEAATEGVENTVVGSGAGLLLTTGNTNTLIGHSAGLNVSTGSSNVIIGLDSGADVTTQSNQLRIANNVTESLIEGDFSAKTVKINGALDITGAITAGSGLGIGKFIDTSIAISSDDTALTNDDGTDNSNIAIGLNAGLNITTGSNNIALGEDALKTGAASSASGNIAFGQLTGESITTGGGNFIANNLAGRYLTSGAANVLIGFRAGQGQSGVFNTASDNIFIGGDSGFNVSTGGFNVGLGNDSLLSVEGGQRNISIGDSSGKYIDEGDWNITIGYQSGGGITTGSKNVLIGYGAGSDSVLTSASSKLHIADNSAESLIEGDFVAKTVKINGTLEVTGGIVGAIQSYTQLIGDGIETAIVVTHSLGVQHVISKIFDATSHDEVVCEVQNTSTTTTTFTFTTAPTLNQFRVIIQG